MTKLRFTTKIEKMLLTGGGRGMEQVAGVLPPGYLNAAAKALLQAKGTIFLATGFPVGGSFESDGPVSAILLYRVLKDLGATPVFICAPPLSDLLAARFCVEEVPICPVPETLGHLHSLLDRYDPCLVVSVERPGLGADGCYRNMRGEDISAGAAKIDWLFDGAGIQSIAFGDGGNEIGMGKVLGALSSLPIHPSVTGCDILVPAAVSNWGVYGVMAMMAFLSGKDLLAECDPAPVADWLVAHGCLDGVTIRREATEDGFPLSRGMDLIRKLRALTRESRELGHPVG